LTSTDTDQDTSTTVAATAQLKLDYTALATVLKLPQMTDKFYATVVRYLVEHTGFVSYKALADVHNEQPLVHNTQVNYTIGVSSELMCTSLWNSNTVQCTIDEYGMIWTSAATTTVSKLCSEQLLAATAVIPIQADVSLDVLNSAIKLSEKQNSAEAFSSNVIGAIIALYWGLYAEQY
jgi:hypothetical protein